MKLSQAFITSALLGFLISAQGTMALAESVITAAALSDRPILGQGYHTGSQQFGGKCLNLHRESYDYAGNQTGSIDFIRVGDQEHVEKSLGFSLNSRARYGLAEASVATNFSSSVASDSYSDSVTFVRTVGQKRVSIKQMDDYSTLFSSSSKKFINSANALTPAFRKFCGDEYVSGIDRGASLYISVKILFGQEHEKQSMSGSLKLSGSIGDLAASISANQSRFSSSSSISVIAYQIGGDPSKMGQLINDPDGKQDSNSMSAMMNCKMSDLGACTSLINSMVSYGTKNRVGDFQTQLSSEYDPTKSDSGAADLTYFTSSWDNLGVEDGEDPITRGTIETSLKELSDYFESMLVLEKKVNELQNGPIKLSEDKLKLLSDTSILVSNGLDAAFNTAQICYSKASSDADVIAVANACKSSIRTLPDRKTISDKLSQVFLDPTICSDDGSTTPYCKVCVLEHDFKPNGSVDKKQCLSCSATVGSLYGTTGNPAVRVGENGPGFTCTNMPIGALVTYSADGNVKVPECAELPRDGENTLAWVLLRLAASNTSDQNQPYDTEKNIERWKQFSISARSTVPTAGNFEEHVLVSQASCQNASGANHVSFDNGYIIRADAEELLIRLGYRQ